MVINIFNSMFSLDNNIKLLIFHLKTGLCWLDFMDLSQIWVFWQTKGCHDVRSQVFLGCRLLAFVFI